MVQQCTVEDIPQILKLYEHARAKQVERNMVVWPMFEAAFLEKEILNKQQFKLTDGDVLTCNWAITYEDKEIWGVKDQDDSIFVHRIATNNNYRGNDFVKTIVDFLVPFTIEMGRKYLRLDTLGDNQKLIAHYQKCGFTYLGPRILTDVAALPKHYQECNLCQLFEIAL